MTKDIEHRVNTLRCFLEGEGAVSMSDDVDEQVEHLLFFGEILGLREGVARVRQRLLLETPAERYRRTERAANTAEKALEEHYMPRIHLLIASGDIAAARELAKEIPSSSVTAVFAHDALRAATKTAQ